MSVRFALAAALLVASPVGAQTITVFAAASLADALTEAAARYEDETGTEATLAFAGSSALARQIQQGAPADLFISANTDWMDTLAAEGLIASETRIDLLGNSLVLIAPAPAEPITPDALDLPALLGNGRLAMALLDAVPAGIYGQAALESLGQWEAVQGQVAQGDNVRAALAFVATGAAPLGIVYGTDAAAEPRVSVVMTFPEGSYPAIRYPAAVTADAAQPEAVGAFLDWLASAPAQAIFARHGFSRPGA
ncbi:molybdate ABC transporter substrate-binding protein [Pararhodobacter marinus]|uniref:Molybdate-binding protein ModA n=1 Tax=Pararhodobacter marinus TaxID=2184063 RepID=A0A2U2C7V5_9RHOB|nr:molybdate ABC transporter substrate-binding protein [Pararhodobacter marinus]PWE27978.1 molybdate ABC transporter substrate-binding protein [Pararhodobacter marinus]